MVCQGVSFSRIFHTEPRASALSPITVWERVLAAARPQTPCGDGAVVGCKQEQTGKPRDGAAQG